MQQPSFPWPRDLVAEILAKIAGRRVIASISGGKDSAAMSLFLTELGIEHSRVFCDTGWEHEVDRVARDKARD